MRKDYISLNGKWQIDYISNKPYTSDIELEIECKEDQIATGTVPGY